MGFASPLHALKSLLAYAFAPKSKLPLLPLNPELGQMSFESYLQLRKGLRPKEKERQR